ncbi:hypothetical protein HPP92_004991 [Vanilla planifolia]|nr:hypothetical protein HPP92_004991 [Vanilla planifolia]
MGEEDFSDDFLLLDFSCEAAGPVKDQNRNPNHLRPVHLFQEIFNVSVDGFPGLTAEGGDGEEEELEWLSNKDAFPSVETSFDLSTHSGCSERDGGALRWPISALTAALPFRAPSRARSIRRRPRRKCLPTFATLPAASSAWEKVERRKCRHCESEETPQWRAGPDGPKTLCNACGVRYKSGRLVPEYRPAKSPTFCAALHSNSHRRVMEMRRRKHGVGRRGRPSNRLTPVVAL